MKLTEVFDSHPTPCEEARRFQEEMVSCIPLLRRYARGLTRDAEAADDLVHDALVLAMEKRHLWQPGSNLKAWLYRILHNTFINHLRREKVRKTVTLEREEDVSSDAADPFDKLDLKRLEAALHALEFSQREVITLVGVEGLSYEEAAKIIGCPLGTVRSRLSRSRRILKHLWEEGTSQS